jgi:hypothetical protein
MEQNKRVAIALFACLALILFSGPSLGATKKHRHPQPHGTQTQETPPNQNNPDIFDYGTLPIPYGSNQTTVPQIVQFITENRGQDDAKRVSSWSDLLQPRPDNALNGITLLLALSGFLLWLTTKKSVKIQERALTELEAPFISVKITDPGIVWNKIQKITFGELKFCFANYGHTPAYILEFIERVTPQDIDKGLPEPIDPIKERGAPMPYGVIAPPQDQTQEFKAIPNVDFFEGGKYDPPLKEVTKKAYFRGYVRYADIFNNRYIIGFSFVFDIAGNRWILMGNEDHNYCRKEKNGPTTPKWYQPSADHRSIRAAILSAMRQTNPGSEKG